MSRNSEKSQSVLHRLQAQRNQANGVLESNSNLRPRYVQSVTSLPQAEKWRSVILSEISVKITRVQDPSLNEYQIRDTNDELNKLFNEKRAWEYHIKNLGGADYITYGKGYQAGGNYEAAGVNIKGYRYFGRAKELADVKEILDLRKKQRNDKSSDKSRQQSILWKEREATIGGFYYGYYDEIDIGNTEEDLIKQVNDIVGDGEEILAVPYIPHEEYNQADEADDDLLKYERKVSKKLFKQLRDEARNADNEITNFVEVPEFEVPSISDIEKLLVDRRRKQILDKLKVN